MGKRPESAASSKPLVVLNIGQLLTMAGPESPRRGREMGSVGLIRRAAVLIEGGLVAAAGPEDAVVRRVDLSRSEIVDAGGRVVMPGFVDAHTHPVFVKPRLGDFEGRIKGLDYASLAARGGGIFSTVDSVRGTGQAELAEGFRKRARRFLECGTTTIEAKSGYGLDLENELKMLRVLGDVGRDGSLEILPTFLGAHAVPPELKGRSGDYVERLLREMIPRVAREKLAVFSDVFCETGYFSVQESRRILEASKKAGLGIKVHAEQLSRSGGAALAAELGAVSADHLDFAQDADARALARSKTVVVLVPGSNYFLSKPYPPARELVDAGAAVALASDFNPGTCPCLDMRLVLSVACTQMRLTIEEALSAATVNGAWALNLGKTHGALQAGKIADLVCHDAEDYRELPYYFGAPPPLWTMKRGTVVFRREKLERLEPALR